VRQRDPPLEAWFNRAMALDALELSGRARAAWESYLDQAEHRKTTSGEAASGEAEWIQEARERLTRVPVPIASTWPEDRERLARGDGFADAAALRAVATRYPMPMREFAQDVLLPKFGRAWTKGELKAAATQTDRLERVAEALMPSGHGVLLSRAVARLHDIERAPRSSASQQLAAGLEAYGRCRLLYEGNQVSAAVPCFTTAARNLTAIPMLADWARLHEAVGLYLANQW